MKDRVGDIIQVKVGEKTYDTMIDEAGVQRFIKNSLLCYLFEEDMIDLNQICFDYHHDKFSKIDYAEFMMALGYSVCGFAELSCFEDMEIENPLWEDKDD